MNHILSAPAVRGPPLIWGAHRCTLVPAASPKARWTRLPPQLHHPPPPSSLCLSVPLPCSDTAGVVNRCDRTRAPARDFTSDFYFRQSWRDERLSFQKSPDLESMTVGAEVAEKIWVPDTFFANEKSAYFHAATTPNTFLRIGSGGEVFRSIR
ncbi:hypothetical protein HPB50_016465 [Hyalomma asiaticum]|uniref:Uncharacterized protein n=1 Tax=Hyalomma asiaticum TaxID=266040 RepID=A0ACB7SP52_HYAAI|nr:hypothetical protein HPB50_016465 [Hyalomma asiaticum]